MSWLHQNLDMIGAAEQLTLFQRGSHNREGTEVDKICNFTITQPHSQERGERKLSGKAEARNANEWGGEIQWEMK